MMERVSVYEGPFTAETFVSTDQASIRTTEGSMGERRSLLLDDPLNQDIGTLASFQDQTFPDLCYRVGQMLSQLERGVRISEINPLTFSDFGMSRMNNRC